MAELINTFSWSISAREDFNECRRRRYWAKYAMWNGWNENAAPIQRAAYRLGKMDNRFSLVGNAVEAAVVWLICRQQDPPATLARPPAALCAAFRAGSDCGLGGRTASVDEAYETAAKPFLNRCWSESLKEQWKANPKKHCCLHEHYYRDFARKTDKEMVAEMIAQVKQCLANFITKVLPGLSPVKRDQEIFIGTVVTKDPESFNLEGIKVYAIPDYVYLRDGRAHIHDWKSGAPRVTHKDQMAIYGLWAALKHKLAPEKVNIHLEYLASGATESAEMTAENLVRAQELIRDSVSEMAEYLIDGDLKRNAPLPKEDWEMSAEMNVCRRCSFYELCKPELET